jgi:plasmid stability protein
MKQLLVRNLEDDVVIKLKRLAARNGLSAEEQHRRLLTDVLNRAQSVREPLASYLVNHPLSPDTELPLERSQDAEERQTGLE